MTEFRPRDPDFEARARASFAARAMMATMGVTVERVAPGEVLLSMPADPRFTQQHGFLHGGAMAACLDMACGFAALTLMPAEAGVLTVEFKTSLLASGRGEALPLRRARGPRRADAHLLRGRRACSAGRRRDAAGDHDGDDDDRHGPRGREGVRWTS